MTWVTEFGPAYAVPAQILEAGLADESWHNDACPAFYYLFNAPNVEETDLVLYVEHPDRAQRELSGEGRFMVSDPNGETVYYEGDDVTAALEALRAEVSRRRPHTHIRSYWSRCEICGADRVYAGAK